MGVPAFRLVQQIRDLTHKTAIEFHRKRRETRDFTSELTAIEGVAEKRKMKLLRNFGSIERIAKATVEELKPFVGAKAAAQIFDHFERQRKLAGN
jgi:excinuclease ABC subunit C